MVTPVSRRPKKRPYAKDYLTRQPGGGNYVLQFRVPDHLKGLPLIGDRQVFRKSLKTKDRVEAEERRNAFFAKIGFFDEQNEETERRLNRQRSPADHYYHQYNALDHSQSPDSLRRNIDNLTELIRDAHEGPETDSSRRNLTMWTAQREAARRVLLEKDSSPARQAELPHSYQITLGSAVTRYEAEQNAKGLKPKTVRKLLTAYGRFRVFIGNDPELPRVRRSVVTAYIRDRASSGLSKATIGNDLSFLAGAFKFAQDEGTIDDGFQNPFKGHSLATLGGKVARATYTLDQVRALLTEASTDRDLQIGILTAYYTGMRLSEVFTATICALDGVSCWSVAEEGGKTEAATRLIPVHESLRAALIKLDVLPAESKAVEWQTPSDQALGKRFGRLKAVVMPRLGIKDHSPYTFHSFRHGFVTALMSAGYTELEVADLSGHKKSAIGRTEAGRTYFGKQTITKLTKMISVITPL